MAGLMSTLEPHVFSAYYPHFCRQSGLSHSQFDGSVLLAAW